MAAVLGDTHTHTPVDHNINYITEMQVFEV